jgi:hypothetical protein
MDKNGELSSPFCEESSPLFIPLVFLFIKHLISIDMKTCRLDVHKDSVLCAVYDGKRCGKVES